MALRSNPYLFFYGAAFFIFAVGFLALLYYSRLSPLGCYLMALNIAVWALVGYDKSVSGTQATRMPEKAAYVLALLGGSVGLLAGMRMFRHKTCKAGFQYVVALIVVLQAVALRMIWRR